MKQNAFEIPLFEAQSAGFYIDFEILTEMVNLLQLISDRRYISSAKFQEKYPNYNTESSAEYWAKIETEAHELLEKTGTIKPPF